MMQILNHLSKFIKQVEGQSTTEYGILLILILFALVVALSIFANTLSALYNDFVTTAFGL
jgi:Flp pilus assembly pilin Flp